MLFCLFVALVSAMPGLLAELICISCSDIPSPALCDKVAKCGKYDECYVDSYVNSFGSVRYDLGCRDSQLCNRIPSNQRSVVRKSGHIDICTECCNGTACNYAGCGGNGIPARTQRGPLCFNCLTELSLDGCSTVKQCNRGEVCVLEAKASHVTGQRIYTTGCMQDNACDSAYKLYASISLGERNFDHSIHVGSECKIECCDTDFCNRACNITKQCPAGLFATATSIMTSSATPPTISRTTKTTINHRTTIPPSSLSVQSTNTTFLHRSTTKTSSMSPIATSALYTRMSSTRDSSIARITTPSYTHTLSVTNTSFSQPASSTVATFGVLTSVSSLLGQTGCTDHMYFCKDPDFQAYICTRSGLSLYCPKSCHKCTAPK